ncbi:MAG: TraX family protein [Treponema sp.]|nr:TraX family protein [Treponema sp.]
MNATAIKIIAIALMLVDHIHQMFSWAGVPVVLKWFGRPVFPLLLFIMAESFYHTRDRKKFLFRLLIGAWFMVIANTVLQALMPNYEIVLMNGAFMSFFVAGLYMLFWDMLVAGIKTKSPKKIIAAILLCFVPVLSGLPALFIAQFAFQWQLPLPVLRLIINAFLLLPSVFTQEAGLIMALGVLFYIFKTRRLAQIAALVAFSLFYFAMGNDAANQWLMVLAAIPMLLYNGEKGLGIKYFFYVFYPAHIYLLYVAATLIKG